MIDIFFENINAINWSKLYTQNRGALDLVPPLLMFRNSELGDYGASNSLSIGSTVCMYVCMYAHAPELSFLLFAKRSA